MRRNDLEETLEGMKDDQLIDTLRDCMGSAEYPDKNEYAAMMRSIASRENGELSPKQRSAVKAHLAIYKRCWY